MSRGWLLATMAGMLASGLSVGGLASRTAASPPSNDVKTLAVLSEHLGYEAALINAVLPRLEPADARIAIAVRDHTSPLTAQLTALLRRRGYLPFRAQALWDHLIGDGAPPPSPVLLYVCSVHALESDRTQLDAAPRGTLGTVLGDIELTLLVEGRQLAARLPGPIGSAADQNQRVGLHLLAPLLIPTDRSFAATA